jgi:hypothetical protein
MAIKTPLYGHTSEETAYIIADYPYGFKLRCTMKVWLEYREGKGFRMVTRTSNPKKPGVWNKPKESTYSALGACLYLDEQGHIHQSAVSLYSSVEDIRAFAEGFPGADLCLVNMFLKAYERREAAKKAIKED